MQKKDKDKKIKVFEYNDKLINHGTKVNKNNHFIQELAKRLVDK